jgi:hypothetical protein
LDSEVKIRDYQAEIQQAIQAQGKINKQQDSDKNNGLSLLAKVAIG